MKPRTGTEVRVARDVWPDADLDIRAIGDGRTFRGYAAVFDSRSEDLGGFRETIRPGAFRKSLRERAANHKMFLNHNQDMLLGTTRAKTLRLVEDDKGLLAEDDLPDTTTGRDLAVLTARGDVDSMSFGFQVIRDAWSDDTGKATAPWEGTNRELVEVRLFEVSAITGWPAYPATSASVRSLEDLAAYLLADPTALGAAIDKLRDGAPLLPQEADLLEAAIEHLEPPEPEMATGEEAGAIVTLKTAARTLLRTSNTLSVAERSVLLEAITARSPQPTIAPTVSAYRERFARFGIN